MDKIIFFLFAGLTFLAIIVIFIYRFFYLPPAPDAWIKNIPVAHRGYFDHAKGIPENSLLAFQRAVDHGYGMELDVWLTKDGEVIVYHDRDLKRLSNKDLYLDDLTLAEIQSIPLMGTNQTPPTLEQVFEVVAGKTPIYVEIKTIGHRAAGELEEKVAALIDSYEEKYGKSARVAMLSFNPASLEWFTKNRPHIPRGQNYDTRRYTSIGEIVRQIITVSLRAQPHFFDIDHERTPRIVQKMLSYLRPLMSYNVKNESQFIEAKKYVSNVIFENIRPS